MCFSAEVAPGHHLVIGAGTGLGLVGFVVGGIAAVAITGNRTGDGIWDLEPLFYGAAAGGTLGMALGVHLGNKRRGNLALDIVTGAAIWGAGIGIVTASDWQPVLPDCPARTGRKTARTTT